MGETDKREQDMLTPNAADLVPVEMDGHAEESIPVV